MYATGLVLQGGTADQQGKCKLSSASSVTLSSCIVRPHASRCSRYVALFVKSDGSIFGIYRSTTSQFCRRRFLCSSQAFVLVDVLLSCRMCSGRYRRPAGRHRRPDLTDRVDGVDRPKLLWSTASTRHRPPRTGPHRRPPQVARVNAVDPAPCSGRRRRPATVLASMVSSGGSTVWTRARWRVDAVDRSNLGRSTPSTRSVGSGRQCRPAGRRCRPECGGASTVSTGATCGGRQRLPDPWGRVDAVDRRVDRVDPSAVARRRCRPDPAVYIHNGRIVGA